MEVTKDKSCIKCKRFFNCNGKPRGVKCLHFVERDKDKDKAEKRN